jgi:hypothetical protein
LEKLAISNSKLNSNKLKELVIFDNKGVFKVKELKKYLKLEKLVILSYKYKAISYYFIKSI